MARKVREYGYTFESVAQLAGVPENTLSVEVKRGNLDMNELESVLVWLAGHARPGVRAKLARQLIPVVLGLVPRRGKDIAGLLQELNPGSDLLVKLFEADKRVEGARRRKISKTKRQRNELDIALSPPQAQ